MSTSVSQHAALQLRMAYSLCRGIARRAAKNFYYGFMLLPGLKRDALCAVYAFMRHADDLSDDPGMAPEERRQKLAEFLDSYHRAYESKRVDDPVFLALKDAQQRYAIPMEWLDQLVAGTGMDVQEPEPQAGGEQVVYATFQDLYRYCYHVASVVGLVCIKIFGYRDAKAEEYAEQLGIAFQLTNILRDVKEDAAMQRIYLPMEDLARYKVTAAELGAGAPMEKLRPLLAFEAQRARQYYESAGKLLPLIEDASQPALWAMVEIYRGILDQIEQRDYDVYIERARLSTAKKLAVFVKGFAKRLL
ncbi:MAG: phytoene/squalene synthase family protein [Acidobacteriota bacterium]|nr:phytoene/squalene synthase family protein [Acidobacteriota bacterium]